MQIENVTPDHSYEFHRSILLQMYKNCNCMQELRCPFFEQNNPHISVILKWLRTARQMIRLKVC